MSEQQIFGERDYDEFDAEMLTETRLFDARQRLSDLFVRLELDRELDELGLDFDIDQNQ